MPSKRSLTGESGRESNNMNSSFELRMCGNYYELVHEGEKLLTSAGCPEPAADARLLLFFVMGWNLTDYALQGGLPCEDDKAERFMHLIERRMTREPLQYITGTASFFGYEFHVTPDVLIPRFDTETLVESVLPHVNCGDRILDMCTGSGCIAITIFLLSANAGKSVSVTASDISEAALGVARENAAVLGAQIRAVRSDLFERIEGTYDIITVNPPYIETEVIGTLDPEVRLFEPHLALDGSDDGLAFYRRIVREAGNYLAPQGMLALEIGFDQSEAVEELLRAESYANVSTVRDLGGNARCVLGYAAENAAPDACNLENV